MADGEQAQERFVAVPNDWEHIVEEMPSSSTMAVTRLPEPASLEQRVQNLNVPDRSLLSDGERYVVTRQLGEGGMGKVFLVEDRDLQRRVAFKTVKGMDFKNGDAVAARRFLREAQVTAQLPHPNIVPIYDLGVRDDGALYYSMPALHGSTLAHLIQALDEKTGPVELPALIDVFLKVCDAVAYAHHRGVLHRDIKPENIIVGNYGEVRLMDWGIARRRTQGGVGEEFDLHAAEAGDLPERAADPSFTCIGDVMGTLAFMPPEQARGTPSDVDERSDLYALGGVLFCILTGQYPRRGQNVTEMLRTAKEERVPSAFSRRRWPIPRPLAEICDKALHPLKECRFQSAREFADAIREARTKHLRGSAARVVLGLAVGTSVFSASLCGLVAWMVGLISIHWTFWGAFLSCSFGLGVASAIEAITGGTERRQ